jgi:hypothetical protein
MTRRNFLVLAAVVGIAVGVCAALWPSALLESKGVEPAPAVRVWMREVGALVLPLGVMAWLARAEPDSRLMRIFLLGNAFVHLGLFPIELLAFRREIITRWAGVAPNTLLHALLAAGFLYFAMRVRTEPGEGQSPHRANSDSESNQK